MAQLVCHLCGEPVTYDEPIPRDSACAKCGGDLRCCRNCRRWDARYSNECTETQADPVQDKTRRNFCEFFYYSREPFTGAPGGGRDRAAEARAKLAALFGGPGGRGGEGGARGVGGERVAGGAGAAGPSGAMPESTAGQAVPPAAPGPTRADEAREQLEKLFGKKGGKE